MVDRRARGPWKRGGETGHNRPGADTRAFEGERVEKYLKELRRTGVPIVAREAANVAQCTVQKKRESDPEFAEAEAEAMESHDGSVEQEIHRRGITGVQEAIYYEGVIVGWKTTYDTQLLVLYAKRRIAAYRDKVTVDQNTNHSGAVAVGLADLSKLSPDGRKLLRELLQKEGSIESDVAEG